jgi:L-tartrate/succinate antiporter
MGILLLVDFALWLFAGAWINPTTVILAVIALLILARILDWDDVIGDKVAWDTLVYFATLLALAEGLERVGVVTWAAHRASSLLVGASPILAIVALVSFCFLIHYMFASLTAHTMAVLPALLATGAAFPGMPVRVLALLLVYSIGLMGVITPYATGPAPVYFESGFIPRKDFWVLGFVLGLIYLTVLLDVGMPYLLTRAS